jgi:nickel-dependent lactate racemase
MRVALDYGRDRVEFDTGMAEAVVHQPPAAVAPAESMRAALEQPVDFPALRRALTPDDHVAVIVDEGLPHVAELLVPLLEHVLSAGVAPEAVSLLCEPLAGQLWVEELPDSLQDVHVETIAPADRRALSYLATTRQGRRLYLNRRLVDADQVVVLSACRFHPLLGYSGAEGGIFPAMGDEEVRRAVGGQVDLDLGGPGPWPVRELATEAAWLLGAPFFVQVIDAVGDGVAAVVAGSTEASRESHRRLTAAWRQAVPQPMDVVVATLSGDPSRHGFADLAAALANAAAAVRAGGRIVVLTQAAPDLGDDAAPLLGAEDAAAVASALGPKPAADQVAAARWARAVSHARVALLSGLCDETAEELFVTPLENASQAQRLLTGGSALFLTDAHRSLAVIEPSG